MAGDLPINERLIIGDATSAARALDTGTAEPERILHTYGSRVRIVEAGIIPEVRAPTRELRAATDSLARQVPPGEQLTELESLGVAAFQLRLSQRYFTAKQNRPRQGEVWNLPEGGCSRMAPPSAAQAQARAAAPPTSAYLEGSVAVGLVIVGGPTAATQFSAAERTQIVAEVQNGLSFYAATYAAAGLSFVYDIQFIQLTVQPDPNAADLEAVFRDPALTQLGFSNSSEYIESLRQNFATRWTYCVFFTKYPVSHFAYAYLGGPHIVMHYDNDGWGPDNIDRVFAHETGHIFNAPDEYASSGCNCGGNWGRWGKPNTNCATCAPNGGIGCIMKANEWTVCTVTPAHIGWMPARLFAKHSGMALDVSGASGASGTRIIQWPYHGGENQLFRPDPVGGGHVRLVAQHSAKVLDIEGGSTASGARAIQYDWHGGDNQLFRLEALGGGHVRVIAKHSGKVLDVAGGSSNAGAEIIQWDWHGGDNQRWLLTAPIVAKHSGKVLDVAGASAGNGAEVIEWDYIGAGNQLFRLERVDGGLFRLVAQHSGKVLDIEGASTASGARAIQWDWHGGDNQLFRLEPLGDGHMRIVAQHSGKVLDIEGGSTASGARAIQWDWHGGNNQRWLVPTW
jgi:hypothetical protein